MFIDHSVWKYFECSGRNTGGGYRFCIESSKMDIDGSIILKSGDCVGQVILPFRVTTGSTENHDTIVHFMTDLTTCLTAGRRQSRLYLCAGVLQACTCPVVSKSVKEDSSDYSFLPLIN
ncbi:hypothetical protein TNCV_4804661 [Trichonephila clavipes]|nr:hypothetical protein TNCV_4804661 [Trichonephila clavipes]